MRNMTDWEQIGLAATYIGYVIEGIETGAMDDESKVRLLKDALDELPDLRHMENPNDK